MSAAPCSSAWVSRRAITIRASALVLPNLIKPETKAVFLESPGSLTFEIQDLPAIADAAHKVRGEGR